MNINSTGFNSISSQLSKKIVNLEKWQSYLDMIILIPIGIIGNSISVVIFSRKIFRETAMGKYLIALSVCDILYQAYSINNFILMVFEPIICQFMWILNVSCMIFNGLIKSVVSIDRMILVRFPTRFHFIKKTWFQLSIIGFLILFTVIPVVTTQCLIKYEIFRKNIKQCFVGTDYVSQAAITVSRTYDLYIGHLLTFSIMLVSGIMIKKKLNESKSRIQSKSKNKDCILASYTIFSITYFLLMSALHMGVVAYQLHLYDPLRPNDLYFFLAPLGVFLKNVELNTSFVIYMFFNNLYRMELTLVTKNFLFIITRGKYGPSQMRRKLKLKKSSLQTTKF